MVTIADFAFRPPSITVRAGQTVTWANSGPSSHTATAGDGSFDTGVLRSGASASHRFTSAGTFAYVCSIHPRMHGTVRVLAVAGTEPGSTPKPGANPKRPPAAPAPAATSSSEARSTARTAPGSSAAAAAPRLPATGFDPLVPAALGAAALAAGAWGLRRVR